MSMLSAQCDELREMADQLQEHGTFVGFGGTTNTDPLMHGAAIVMREAADTIWELRDDLQRANDALRDAEHDESRAWDRVRKVEAENSKLRELVRGLDWCTENPESPDRCDRCPLVQSDGLNPECEVMMRELRVKKGYER